MKEIPLPQLGERRSLIGNQPHAWGTPCWGHRGAEGDYPSGTKAGGTSGHPLWQWEHTLITADHVWGASLTSEASEMDKIHLNFQYYYYYYGCICRETEFLGKEVLLFWKWMGGLFDLKWHAQFYNPLRSSLVMPYKPFRGAPGHSKIRGHMISIKPKSILILLQD